MSFDPIFKDMFGEPLRRRGINVKEGHEVGKLPLRTDIIFINEQNVNINDLWGNFGQYLTKHTIVEFKSQKDSPSITSFLKLTAYLAYYWVKEGLNFEAEAETTGWFITSLEPSWLQEETEKKTFSKLQTGLYQYNRSWQIYLVNINELSIQPENYRFLIFARGEKLLAFIKHIFMKQYDELIPVLSYLYPKEVTTLSEAEEIPMVDVQEKAKSYFKKIGLENIFSEEELKEALQKLTSKKTQNS